MEKDIEQKILQDFGAQGASAIDLLNQADVNMKLGPRVCRCIVKLANGDISKLKEKIQEAEIDWRDLILAAEEEPFELKRPFNL